MKCKDCFYFEAIPKAERLDRYRVGNGKSGECRRFPLFIGGKMTYTYENLWCGEFKEHE